MKPSSIQVFLRGQGGNSELAFAGACTGNLVTAGRPSSWDGPGTAEAILVPAHLHPRAAKRDSFRFQTQALLDARFARQKNFPAGSDHPVPRQIGGARGAAERPGHLARCAWKSRRPGHGSVARDAARGNQPDDLPNSLVVALRLAPIRHGRRSCAAQSHRAAARHPRR